MSDQPIRFGTDAWRAVIGEQFTFDNVRACAQATALYIQETGLAGRGVVIGYDTRFASEEFAAAVAEVMAGGGAPPHPGPLLRLQGAHGVRRGGAPGCPQPHRGAAAAGRRCGPPAAGRSEGAGAGGALRPGAPLRAPPRGAGRAG